MKEVFEAWLDKFRGSHFDSEKYLLGMRQGLAIGLILGVFLGCSV